MKWSNMTDFEWKSGNLKNCCNQMASFKAKMHKFDFGWGSASNPLAGFEGSYF